VLVKLGYRLPYLSAEQVESVQRVAPRQAEQSESSLPGELRIFAERLIYALCPPDKGYAPKLVEEVRTIYDVLEGRRSLDEWFTSVRQMLGLKPYQLAAVIYQCLDGLRSKEARELRDQWYGYLQAELKGYGVI
jgi:hypothetical protein